MQFQEVEITFENVCRRLFVSSVINRILENDHRQSHHDAENNSRCHSAENVKLWIAKNVAHSIFFEEERRYCIIACSGFFSTIALNEKEGGVFFLTVRVNLLWGE